MLPVWPLLLRFAALVAVACLLGLAIAVDLAPLAGAAQDWAMPDLPYLVLTCLVLRRPALVPMTLVFGAGLVRDLLMGGAVGPGTLALLLVTEALRRRAPALHRRGFAAEWLLVAVLGVAVALLPATMLWLVLADVPLAGPLAARMGTTALAYPFVVALLRFGREKPRAAEGRA